MITKNEIDLMIKMYNNNGNITAKTQDIFVVNSRFYERVTKLKRMKLISSYLVDGGLADRRFNIYELTARGITLIKILLGEDY